MGVSLSSLGELAAAIRRSSDVRFGSFVLGKGPVRDALVAAANNGAHVDVVLQRQPYMTGAGGKNENRRTAEVLRDAGATVTLRERGPNRPWFHLKAAVCDGVAYLDDRNFAHDGNEIVVRDDDAGDVAMVKAALHGTGSTSATLATRKDDALYQEAALIRNAGDAAVVVETETFGPGIISSALRAHAERGASTTLIVAPEQARNARTRAMLASLRADGVDVRETGTREKLALAGDAAWIGSANATYACNGAGRQIDWGLVTCDAALVGAVRAALRRDTAGDAGG